MWQRFREPAFAGVLEPPGICTGAAQSPGGDLVVELDLRVRQNAITDAAFRAHGCPTTVAAADWLCAHVCGESVPTATAITAQDIEQALQLMPHKRGCCLVVIDAFGAALAARVTVGTNTGDKKVGT